MPTGPEYHHSQEYWIQHNNTASKRIQNKAGELHKNTTEWKYSMINFNDTKCTYEPVDSQKKRTLLKSF